jgi:hypothetical protein
MKLRIRAANIIINFLFIFSSPLWVLPAVLYTLTKEGRIKDCFLTGKIDILE